MSTLRRAATDAQLPMWQSERLGALRHVRHGFFGRQGGCSQAPYQSLNVSMRVGDDAAQVGENRALVLAALGLRPSAWRNVKQCHANTLHEVTPTDDPLALDDVPADAMMSMSVDCALAIFTADCVPILLSDTKGLSAAAVHAGWRGVAGKIAERSARSLSLRTGVSSSDLVAAIGPAIGPCCFVVGPEVVSALDRALGAELVALAKSVSTKDGDCERVSLDLWELNKQQLLCAGLLSENIDVVRHCTVCENNWFFSHRKEHGLCGRQAAVIALAR